MPRPRLPGMLLPAAATPLLLLAFSAAPVYGHGFGERYDLPLPLSYFAAAGASAVILSFVVVGLFVRAEGGPGSYPRFNLFRYAPVRFVLTVPFLWAARVASVFLFFLIIATGLFGSDRPVNNLTPTFVWIIWWVGMGFVVSLLGNLWAAINPWSIIFDAAEFLYHKIRPAAEWEMSLGWEYAERLGVWPSVALFFAFVWVENALPESAAPSLLAWLIAAYSLLTLGGMYLFGKHQWLRHGEVFSVVYSFLTRFSITETRTMAPEVCRQCSSPACQKRQPAGECVDCYECFRHAEAKEFNLRPPAIGLNAGGEFALPTGMTALVILVLATVTFDGFSDTPEWAAALGLALEQTPGLTSPYFNGLALANTLGLLAFPLAFAAIYWGFSALMGWVVKRAGGSSPDPAALMAAFCFSLAPIALAYHFAHYLGFLLIQGQLIIPLASDPFGFGMDWFGTAGYTVNIAITNARFIWFFAVTSIVTGHIVAVYLAHLRASAIYRHRQLAWRSQLPMLGLMVIYTVVSLWIISRPITE